MLILLGMNKQRKIFNGILIFLSLALIIINVVIVAYGEIASKPDNWAGYIALAIIDGVIILAIIIIIAVFLPRISKVENQLLKQENDFNVLNLTGKVDNTFDVYHSEIIGASFLSDKVVFKRVKFSINGTPVLKDEQKVLSKRKVEISDLCTFDMEVNYSDLNFSVVTNRNYWNSVPNIGIAVKFNKEIVDTFIEPEQYAIINASKELLYYILGNENKLVNSELLIEKQLTEKPKVIKKFNFAKLKWWIKLIILLGIYAISIVLGIYVSSYSSVPIAVIATLSLIPNNTNKLVFYNKYFSDGIKLCTLKEITKVYKKQFSDNKTVAIAIVTPVFTLMHPFKEDLWQYLNAILPDKIIND